MSPLLRSAAAAVIMTSLAACSSTPDQHERALASQPLKSAPFELVASDRGPVLTLEDLQFDFEKAALRPEANGIVGQAAQYLQANRDRVAVVEGHTDHTGQANYNVMLSEARSKAVADALIKAGVAPQRIFTHGLGETKPVASNATLDGRMRNRRVEIIFQKADSRTSRSL